MENNFDNKDFEHFLKQSADQYRMFPSEKVWNGINNTLHTRRRWYGIGLTLLLLTVGVVTWIMLLNPSQPKEQTAGNSIAIEKSVSLKNLTIDSVLVISSVKSAGLKQVLATPPVATTGANLFFADLNAPSAVIEIRENIPAISFNENVTKPIVLTNSILPKSILTTNQPVADKQFFLNNTEIKNFLTADPKPTQDVNYISATDGVPANEKTGIQHTETVVNENDNVSYPYTIESVVNSFQTINSRRKKIWQIYFLPTVSYRRLREDKNSYLLADVNNAVTHKPDIGLELGFNVGYPVGKNLKITTGLQLNVSKYDIKAYPYPAEQTNLILNNNNGSTSVSRLETSYRNFQTFANPDWLSNFYISASLPVGLEVNLTDARKNTYLGVGGTVQPTYILGDRAYLISNDLKNYAKAPSLTREWNMSSSFEVFAGYSTGKLNWKVGPQIRYQMLSSFAKKYPVKEHLMDFGLKVGVMFR